MDFQLGKKRIDGANMLLYLCFFLVCLSGHNGISAIETIGRYLMFGLLVLFVIRENVDRNKTIMSFCIINLLAFLFSTVFNVFSGSIHFKFFNSFKAVMFYCLFAYCGYYIARKVPSERIWNLIRRASIVATVIVMLQYICAALGVYLNRLPILGEYLFYAVDTDRYFRPAAYFSEPSYMAEIVLLDLFNNLFRKRNLKMALFDIIALALSTSGLGIVFGFGLLVAWAISQKLVRNSIINFLIKIMLSMTFAVGLYLFLNYSGENAIINRILRGSTLSERTLRAFEIYSKLQPGEQIFGIGMQNLTSYLNYHPLVLINQGVGALVNKEFAQSFGYILLSLGVLGAVNYIGFFISLAKQTPRNYRMIYALFLAISLTASLITRNVFVLYSAALWSLVDDRKKLNSKAQTLRI